MENRGWAASPQPTLYSRDTLDSFQALCPPSFTQDSRSQESVPHPHLGPGARKGGDTFRFWSRRLTGYTCYRTTSKTIATGREERNTHGSRLSQYPHPGDGKLRLESLWESHTPSKKRNFRTLDPNVLLWSSFCSPHPSRIQELGNPMGGRQEKPLAVSGSYWTQ